MNELFESTAPASPKPVGRRGGGRRRREVLQVDRETASMDPSAATPTPGFDAAKSRVPDVVKETYATEPGDTADKMTRTIVGPAAAAIFPEPETASAAGESAVGHVPLAADSLPVATPSTDPMWRMIERLATDPQTNVENLERMVGLYERMNAQQAKRLYDEAMVRVQSEIEPIVRTTQNTGIQGGKAFYAKLEEVVEAIRPVYLRHGFSLQRNTVPPLVDGNIRVEVTCSHSGHSERFYREAGPDVLGAKGAAVKTTLHGSASTETFLTRYAIAGIFNLVFVNQDDDGTGGTIAEEDAHRLVDLIKQAKAGPRWLKYMKLEAVEGNWSTPGFEEALIASVGNLPARDFRKAILSLEDLIAQRSNEGGTNEGTTTQADPGTKG